MQSVLQAFLWSHPGLDRLSLSFRVSRKAAPLNPLPATLTGVHRFSQESLPVSPFPATLTGRPQLSENKTALSLAFATLTRRVKPKSFVCHSYKKQGGGGYPPDSP